MTLKIWILSAGLTAGFFGSLILARSFKTLLPALVGAVLAHDTTLVTHFSGQNVPVFRGLDKHVEEGLQSARKRIVIGCTLLAVGFAAELVAIVFL